MSDGNGVGSILTGIAAMITAVVGAIVLLKGNPTPPETTTPTETTNPPETTTPPGTTTPPDITTSPVVEDFSKLLYHLDNGQFDAAKEETYYLLSEYEGNCQALGKIDYYWRGVSQGQESLYRLVSNRFPDSNRPENITLADQDRLFRILQYCNL